MRIAFIIESGRIRVFGGVVFGECPVSCSDGRTLSTSSRVSGCEPAGLAVPLDQQRNRPDSKWDGASAEHIFCSKSGRTYSTRSGKIHSEDGIQLSAQKSKRRSATRPDTRILPLSQRMMHVDHLLQLHMEQLALWLLRLALRSHRFLQLSAKSAPKLEILYHGCVIYIADSKICYGFFRIDSLSIVKSVCCGFCPDLICLLAAATSHAELLS